MAGRSDFLMGSCRMVTHKVRGDFWKRADRNWPRSRGRGKDPEAFSYPYKPATPRKSSRPRKRGWVRLRSQGGRGSRMGSGGWDLSLGLRAAHTIRILFWQGRALMAQE